MFDRLYFYEDPDSVIKNHGFLMDYKDFKNYALSHELDYKIFIVINDLIKIIGSDYSYEIAREFPNVVLKSKLSPVEKIYILSIIYKDSPPLRKLSERLDLVNSTIRKEQGSIDSLAYSSLLNNYHDYNWQYKFIRNHTRFILDSTYSRNNISFNIELLFDPKFNSFDREKIYDYNDSLALDPNDTNQYNFPHNFFRKRAMIKIDSGKCDLAIRDFRHVQKLRGNQNHIFWKGFYRAAICLNDTSLELEALSNGINTIDSWADSIFESKYPEIYKIKKKNVQTIFDKKDIPKIRKNNYGMILQIKPLFRGESSQFECGPGYYVSRSNDILDFTFNANYIYDFKSNDMGASFSVSYNYLIHLEYSRVYFLKNSFWSFNRASIGVGIGYLNLAYVHNFTNSLNLSIPQSMFGLTISLPYPIPKI